MNVSKLLVLTVLTLLMSESFSSDGAWPHEGTFTGIYASGFESSLFVPDGARERWWLNGDVPCDASSLMTRGSRPKLFATIRAKLSGKGSFGHLGMYSRQISPSAFLVCREATPEELRRVNEPVEP